MILSFIAAFLIAKIKKYRVIPAFQHVALYPLFAVELFYWFLQVKTFLGSYGFFGFEQYLKRAYLLVLLLPILLFRLYLPSIVSAGLVITGTILNKVVIQANGGKMPIYATLSKLTGYFDPDVIKSGADTVHSLGNAATKLKILTDYFDIGWSILSLGDLLIHSSVAVIVYYTIREMNRKKVEKIHF